MAVDFRALFTSRYPAGTTTIYVSASTGSDSNPGTSAQPKATIQGGISAIGTSGTVLVRNGSYTNPSGEIRKSGTAGNYVRVMADVGQNPTIASPGNYQSLGIFDSAYFVWYGFNITGVSSPTSLDSVGVVLQNSHHIALWKCTISNCSDAVLGLWNHHVDICYNRVGPNVARYRPYSAGIMLKGNLQGGNDADGFSSRIIGNVVHDVYQDPSLVGDRGGGQGIWINDASGRDGSGGTATTDQFLIGFNLLVNNGHGGLEAWQSDNVHAYFNTIAHNMRQAGATGTSVNDGEINEDTDLLAVTKWNAIGTSSTRPVPLVWFNKDSSSTPDPVDNVITRGTTPTITPNNRSATGTGDAWYKSPNDAMTNIDGWRPASNSHSVSLDGASGGTTARDALQAWPDWFGELRPTAAANTWHLGFAEPDAAALPTPIADFTATPNPANINQTITFTDISANNPTSWLWNFGDGTTSTSQNPTKSYTTAGTKNVTLTATNASGSNGKTIQVVVSAPQNTSPYEAENATLGGGVEAPQVLNAGSGHSGDGYVFMNRIGNFAQFSLTGLAAGDYAFVLRWGKGDLGSAARRIVVNGSEVQILSINQTGTSWSDVNRWVESQPVTVTLTGGTNLIRVEYSGTTDLQGTHLDRITVTPIVAQVNPPVANFIFSPNNPTPGSLVSFTNTSTNSPTSFLWDFGDGVTSNAQNPTHAFVNAGTYQVSLTAGNAAGSNTRTLAVVVTGVVAPTPSVGTFSITVTGNPLLNQTNYTAHVEVRDSNGIIGFDDETFSTAWTPPNTTAFTVTSLYASSGYVSIDWTHTGADPDWTAWRVYHRVQGEPWTFLYETRTQASTYSYHDWIAPTSENMQWAVVQVVERFGSETESAYGASTAVVLVSPEYWLINPTDETKNLKLHVIRDRFQPERERAVIPIIGRGRRVEFGTNYGIVGTMSARIRRDNTLSPRQQRKRLEELQEEATAYYLRTPFGDVWRVTVADIPVDWMAGAGTEELADIEITYTEVS
jgi:PKD repeat protein